MIFQAMSFSSLLKPELRLGVHHLAILLSLRKNLKVLEVGWDHHESFSGASHWRNKGNVAISEHEKHCHTLSSSH